MHFPDRQFVHDFVPLDLHNLLHYLEQRIIQELNEHLCMTKSYTNKFCLKKVLEGFYLLEYGYRGKRKECASVRLASSGTKDQAANYDRNEDYGNEIMPKTKLESIT